MALDKTARRAIISSLNRRAANQVSEVGALRDCLHAAYRTSISRGRAHPCGVQDAAQFISASVEIWHRAIHSLIVSVAVTKESPVWACVAAYYASHYTMRAVAHLNGWVCIKKPSLVLEISYGPGGKFTLDKGAGASKEHEFYWKKAAECIPNESPLFHDANLDQKQRNGSNYWDQIDSFRKFSFPIDQARVREAFEYLASQRPTDIPEFTGRPLVAPMQTNSLRRIERLRRLFDNEFGQGSRYWNTHRDPSWARDIVVYPEDADPELANAKAQGRLGDDD